MAGGGRRLLQAVETVLGEHAVMTEALDFEHFAIHLLSETACIVFSHCLFLVAQQIRDIGHRNAVLQQDARKRVAEPVRRRTLRPDICQFEDLAKPLPPCVDHGIEPLRSQSRTAAYRVA